MRCQYSSVPEPFLVLSVVAQDPCCWPSAVVARFSIIARPCRPGLRTSKLNAAQSTIQYNQTPLQLLLSYCVSALGKPTPGSSPAILLRFPPARSFLEGLVWLLRHSLTRPPFRARTLRYHHHSSSATHCHFHVSTTRFLASTPPQEPLQLRLHCFSFHLAVLLSQALKQRSHRTDTKHAGRSVNGIFSSFGLLDQRPCRVNGHPHRRPLPPQQKEIYRNSPW